MALDLNLVLYGLIAVDVVLYVLLLEGFVRNRRALKAPRSPTCQEVFAFFEKTYKAVFPQDRTFTWAEASARASGLVRLRDFEWERVQKSVRQYEAYRFGGLNAQQVDTSPILKLALALRKKS